jgi:DNA-binding IclR family transcriptional regulator
MIRVVKRALKVLECFDLERPRLSLHDISLRIGLPKSTTFRVLSTLVAEGYLVQPDRQEYALSHKLMRLAGVAQHTLGLRDIAHPVLQRLAAETGETAEISVLDGDGRICLDVVESSSSLKSIVSIGTRLPLLFGATGKAFLAHLDAGALAHALAARPDAAIDHVALERQLAAIREDGYSLTRDERVLGATAVAVPIRDREDRVCYCLTVTGPSGRFVGREDQVRGAVLAAASDLSMLLGGKLGGNAPTATTGRASAVAAEPSLPQALQHLRVLDLTEDFGYASRVYSDLGATVILVEPPGGMTARRDAQLLRDRAGPDRRLHFQYLNAGKCSVVVDFGQDDDRAFFARLLDDADLVIDDQLQDVWVQRGFGFDLLTARHPQLVWCAITPSGQRGPQLADHADSRPIHPNGALARYSAAQHAAVTSLTVLLGRSRGGSRFVDVSVQEVVAVSTGGVPHDPHAGADTPYRLDPTPRRAGRRAPRLGEHTERLRRRYGLTAT